MPAIRNLILVLGDQLTPTLTSLATGDPARDLVLMAELHDEATSVPHHKKKMPFCSPPYGISRGAAGGGVAG